MHARFDFWLSRVQSGETMGPCGSRCQESWWNVCRGFGTLDVHSSGWSGGIEDETQDHVEFWDDAELDSDIEAIVGALEPVQESVAIWKQTRMAIAREKLNRGLGTSERTRRNKNARRHWTVKAKL